MVLIRYLLIWTIIAAANSNKLNVPKVLLPYRASKTSPAVNFTLEITDANGGASACFQWKSTRPEVAEIHSVFDQSGQRCSSRAIISAVSRHASRRTAIVSAEDIYTGAILRCDVMVDALHSLEIETTTRQLYLEDSPELFIVRAKNIEGDTFVDLDGLAFEWSVDSATGRDHDAIDRHHAPPARIVSFSESSYETTAAIRRLETQRQRGDRILVEGVSTGVAVVSVHSREEAYQSIQPYSIQLTVMALLTLEPSADIRIPIGSRVHYTLKLIRYRKAEIIPMPSAQYKIQVEMIEPESGVDVARFHEKTSILEALALGTVRLSVEDKKLDMAISADSLPSAYVYVVEPTSIIFTISTGIWVLEMGRSYDINVELVDAQGRPLFMTENTIIDVAFPSGLLRSTQISPKNGTIWRIVALKEGSDSISAKYDSFLDVHGNRKPFEPAVYGQQSVEVFPSMSITPPLLVLPPCHQASTGLPCFERQLTVHGGSGRFLWTVDNFNFSVHQASRISVQGLGGREALVSAFEGGPAAAFVTASDARNHLHKASAKVVITDPVKAEFIDGSREVEIGSTLHLGLRLLGKVRMSEERLVPFTDCRQTAVDVHLSDDSLVNVQLDDAEKPTPGLEEACITFSFVGRSIGDVTVSVTVSSHGGSTDVITATTIISVFAPLEVVSPASSQLLLTPTSSYAVVFSGGPRPLPADPASHFVAVERLGKSGVDDFETSTVMEAGRNKAYKVTVVCLSGTSTPSEASILISVGNKKTATNKFPALSTANVKIRCDFPSSLSLQLKRAARAHDDVSLPPCSLDKLGTTDAIPVHVGTKFDVVAHLYDSENRRFDNASALLFSWRVSDSSVLRPPASKARALQWRNIGDVSYEFYETFHPIGSEGDVRVTAEVSHLAKDTCSLKVQKACEDFLRHSLKTSLLLRLVQYAALIPSTVVLYNHPKNSAVLTITGGSGQFVVTTDNAEGRVISWNLLDGSRKVEVYPGGGGIGEATMKVYDSCLLESPPATATIIVSTIEKLALTGPSLVMLGKRLKLRVQAMDGSGRQLLADEIFGFLPLEVVVDGTGLVRRSKKDASGSTLIFEATEAGIASVTASVTDPISGNIIRSSAHRVQVFPSLEVEPKLLTLIAGARFQIRITGGLQYSQSTWFIDPASSGVTFTANDTKVLTIGPDGLIEAKRPGSVTISARLTNPEKSDEILGEDFVTVRVIQLMSVKIHVPVTTAYVGSKIPLTFVGYAHREPHSSTVDSSSLDLVLPWGISSDIPLKAKWTVDGDGAELEPKTDFVTGSIILNCVKSGSVHVRLSVEQTNPDLAKAQFAGGIVHKPFRAVLNASVTITIVDEIRFAGPKAWRQNGNLPPLLLMSHNATTDVKFSRPLRNLQYRTFGDSYLVDINDSGLVHSTVNNERKGDASVLVTGVRADAPTISEVASLTIQVSPVSYLLASSNQWSIWKENRWPNGIYPVQYAMKFVIGYHDNHGRRFDAVSRQSPLAVRPNRFDLIDITIAKEDGFDVLLVGLKDVGETVIKLWNVDSPNTIFGYLRLSAVNAIQPSASSIQIGQRLGFSNSLSSGTADGFVWSSSNPAVLEIDTSTGVAFAKSPGQATISQALRTRGSDAFVSSTSVTVPEPTSISLSKIDGPEVFVDADDESEHLFAVKFHGSSDDNRQASTFQDPFGSKIKDPIYSASLPFSCHFQISPAQSTPDAHFFRIEPALLSSNGFACILKKVSPLSTTATPDLGRNISIWANRGPLLSETLTYPIYAPIKIQPSVELVIDNERMSKGTVRILAPGKNRLDHVKVSLSNDARDLLTVTPVPSSDGKQGQQPEDQTLQKEFIVRLRSDAAVDLAAIGLRNVDHHVAIIDEATTTIHRLPIRIKFHARLPAFQEAKDGGLLGALWNLLIGAKQVYGTVLLLIASAAVTMASVYFGYKYLTGAGKTGTTAAGNVVPPISPASIPWRSYGQGVRSPQLWSVERSQTSPSPSPSPKDGTGSFLSRRLLQ